MNNNDSFDLLTIEDVYVVCSMFGPCMVWIAKLFTGGFNLRQLLAKMADSLLTTFQENGCFCVQFCFCKSTLSERPKHQDHSYFTTSANAYDIFDYIFIQVICIL